MSDNHPEFSVRERAEMLAREWGQVPLSEIDVHPGRRRLGDLEPLVESIIAVGLLNPITVTVTDDGRYRLIAGWHRLEACRSIGCTMIPVNVVTLDALLAELAELDENIVRQELTALERGEHLLRRKEIYEQLHPETRHGGDRRSDEAVSNRQNDGLKNCFTKDTVEKVGVSERTIERAILIAKALPEPIRDRIRGTPLADRKAELLALARVKPPDVQAAVVDHLLARPESEWRERGGNVARARDAVMEARREATAGMVVPLAVLPDARYNVVLGNCMEVIPTLERGSVRLAFADPPYNIGIDYGEGHDDNIPVERFRAWLREWIQAIVPVLTDDGSFWCLINHEGACAVELAIEAAGLTVLEWITWYESFGVNCFRRDTRFITGSGVRSFAEFRDGDETTVWSHTGRWCKAIVRCHGPGKLYRATFRRKGGRDLDVWTTANHRWLLSDGRWVDTDTLPDRAIIASAPTQPAFDYWSSPPDERLWWAYGFVFGDGSIARTEDGAPKHSLVRLCGDEKVGYRSRFEELGFTTMSPRSIQGDVICYTGKYFKEVPDPSVEEHRHIRAFVRGYLDADGVKNRNYPRDGVNPFHGIQATGSGSIEFIRRCFPVAGWYVTAEQDLTGDSTNFVVRPETVRFAITDRIHSSAPYRLVGVDWGRPEVEEMWCLEVEEDHSFVMPCGLVTGNCTDKCNRTSRRLFHAVVDPKRYVFNKEALNRKSVRQEIGDGRAAPGGKIWDDVWGIHPPIPRLVGNAKERLAGFPTQLPMKLLRPIVGVASDPGDLVLDPFSGSGTTGAVALELGRRYVGIERSYVFRDQSLKRLKAIASQRRLFDV